MSHFLITVVLMESKINVLHTDNKMSLYLRVYLNGARVKMCSSYFVDPQRSGDSHWLSETPAQLQKIF